MDFKTKFDLGEKVFVTEIFHYETEPKICWLCGGTNAVTGFDGTVRGCPVCDGTGEMDVELPSVMKVVGQGKIVQIHAYAHNYNDEIHSSEGYEVLGNKPNHDYEAFSYDLSKEALHRTLEDAEAACKQYNEASIANHKNSVTPASSF